MGNPPYQAKNNMQAEYGPAYLNRLREAYPDIPGRADYCVYWFRKAHDVLSKGGHAGMVGTNTIRQNYSREGGLDYIVGHGGTITEAVSTQVWSGDAEVHVSIVNWVKGEEAAKKKLFTQLGDDVESAWEVAEVDVIGPALSAALDVTKAVRLRANIKSGACYQGQTHGHEGFLLSPGEAEILLKSSAKHAEVLLPYLTGDDLLSHQPPRPQRYVIDLQPRNVLEAGQYPKLLERLKATVLPARQTAARAEEVRNKVALDANLKAKVNQHNRNFLNKWWLLSYPRSELIATIATMPRYIACSRITRRQIFEFVSSNIRPNDKLQVFALCDDYSFGVISSELHWKWFVEKCTTLKHDFNYNSDAIWDTFPWPQKPTLPQVKKVTEAAVALRELRRKVMAENGWSLRELYRTPDVPGKNPLRTAQDSLDAAVRVAYGMKPKEEPLAFLLALNAELADREATMKPVIGPGLPPCVIDVAEFVTSDCVEAGN